MLEKSDYIQQQKDDMRLKMSQALARSAASRRENNHINYARIAVFSFMLFVLIGGFGISAAHPEFFSGLVNGIGGIGNFITGHAVQTDNSGNIVISNGNNGKDNANADNTNVNGANNAANNDNSIVINDNEPIVISNKDIVNNNNNQNNKNDSKAAIALNSNAQVSQNNEESNSPFHSQIVAGQKVRWQKNLTVGAGEKIIVPELADEISVKQRNNGNNGNDGNGNFVIASSGNLAFKKNFAGKKAELSVDTSGDLQIEYTTPAPSITEENTNSGKIVKVSAPDELNYTDVLSFATIPERLNVGQERFIKINWIEEGKTVDFTAKDTDNNGKLDYVEWVTPHLSNQTFEIIIITKAEHLDSNREFISDIYDFVKALDGNWSETINDNEYVRVTFQKKLTSANDITIYPRVASGNPSIGVYEMNGSILIAEFDNIKPNEYNKVFLSNLTGSQDTFDLKMINGAVQFDYILDPIANDSSKNISQCGTIDSPGVYQLNQSITNVTTCLTINVGNVTVNCTGYTIYYNTNNTNGSIGINVSKRNYVFKNITIQNCIIMSPQNQTERAIGILFGNVSDSYILNNTILTNGTHDNYGIYIVNSSYRNTVANNTIFARGTFTGVTNTNNNNIGIYLGDRSSNTTVSNNIINTTGNATNYGIYANGVTTAFSNNNLISSNIILTNGSGPNNHGIYITANINSTEITLNNITTNGTTTNHGIYILGVASGPASINNVSSNIIRVFGTAAAQSNYGILVSTNVNLNNISNNNITTTGTTASYGVYVVGTAANAANSNTINSNYIWTGANNLSTTNNYGIYLATNTNNNIITNNVITTGFINGSQVVTTTGNAGIVLSGGNPNATYNLVAGNTIRTYGTTTNYGIYFTANTSLNNVTGNNITTNGTTTNYGVYFIGSYASPVSNNIVSSNNITTRCNATSSTCYGVYITAYTYANNITSNDIEAGIGGTTPNVGVYVLGAAGTMADLNRIDYNVINTYGTGASNYGVWISTNSSNNTITWNNITTNGSTTNHGIYITGAALATPSNYNQVTFNNVRTYGNVSIANSNYGVYVTTNANGNNVSYNNITTHGSTTNYGVSLVGTAALPTDNNTIDSNYIYALGNTTNNYGVYLTVRANNNDVTNNTITTGLINDSGAIIATTGNAGIVLIGGAFNTTYNEIRNNTIVTRGTTTGYGIYLNVNASQNNITGNSIITNGSTTNYGIYFLGSYGGPVSNNIIYNNSITTIGSAAASNAHGVFLTLYTYSNNITNNDIQAGVNSTAGNNGVYILGAAGTMANSNRVDNNRIYTYGTGASNVGINISINSSGNDVTWNNITTNGSTGNHGIVISGVAAATPSNSNEVSFNTIRTYGNVSIANTNMGVVISTNANLNNITENNITTHGSTANYGVYLLGTVARLNASNNWIDSNLIYALGNTTNNYGIYLATAANNNDITYNNITTGLINDSGQIIATTGNAGIVLSGGALNVTYNEICNNTIYTYGTTTNYGIYFTANTSQNNVTGNVIVTNGTTTSYGIYFIGSYGGPVSNNIVNMNNITTRNYLTASTAYGVYLTAYAYSNNITSNDIEAGVGGTTPNVGVYVLGAAATMANYNRIDYNVINTYGNISGGGSNYGIWISTNSSNNTITWNNITTNGSTTDHGIYITGAALATPANYNEVSFNNIRTYGNVSLANTNYGVYVTTNANGNNVSYNNITTHGSTANYGVSLVGTAALATDNNTIDSNYIYALGNTTNNYGVYLTIRANNNDITNNTITTGLINDSGQIIATTGNIGIALVGGAFNATYNEIRNNTINTYGTTTNYGIYLNVNASQNNITGNYITTNGTTTGYGIYFLGSYGGPVSNNIIYGNNITTRCSAAASNAHGIYLTAYTYSNNITCNEIDAGVGGTASNNGIYILGATTGMADLNRIDYNVINTYGSGAGNLGVNISTNSSSNDITYNNVTTNGSTGNHGVFIAGTALATPSNSNEITYNTISTNGLGGAQTNYGIALIGVVNSNNVSDNNITTHGTTMNYGIYVNATTSALNSSKNWLDTNVIYTQGNTTNNYGIYIVSSTNNDITYNNITTGYINDSNSTISTTGNIGIFLSGGISNSTFNEITNNTIRTYGTTTGYGVYLNINTTYNNITSNDIITNGTTTNYGIYLAGASSNAPVNSNFINNNSVITRCSGASCHGIYVTTRATSNNISGNYVETHGSTTNYGIFIQGISGAPANLNFIGSNNISTYDIYSHGIYLSLYSNSTVKYNTISALKADRILINSTYTNNNLTGNNFTNRNYSYYDINFSTAGNNGTWLIDQYFENYTFAGFGGIMHVVSSLYGQIHFIPYINGTGANFSGDVNIGNNSASVNSLQKGLNKSANVTFYNLPTSFTHPVILMDGAVCPTGVCNNFTDLNAGNVYFNVSYWSNYTVAENGIPTISITSPANNTNTSDTGLDIKYNVAGLNLNSCWYSNDSMGYNYSLTNCGTNITGVTWTEGQHNVTIWVNNTFNDINSSSVTFYIDSIAPTISITSPANNTNSSNTALVVNYTVSDSGIWGLGSCWYSNDSMGYNYSLTDCGTNITGVTWAEGQHNVTVWANDTANNLNSTSVRFNIDTTKPLVSIVYPLNQTYNVNISELNYTVSDLNIQACLYSLNGAANASVTCGTNLTGLTSSQGSNTWIVSVNDSANNWNSSSVTFFKDTINPNINFTFPTGGSNITWLANSFYVNVSSNDTNNHYTILDWNRSLVLWMRFENQTGENGTYFKDESSWSNNGTCTSCPKTNYSGRFGSALTFDGVNNNIKIPNSNVLNVTSAVSVSAWIKTTSANSAIINKDNVPSANTRQYVLGMFSSKLDFYVFQDDSTFVHAATTTNMDDGLWHHVVGTIDTNGDGKARIYVDGDFKGVSLGSITSIQATVSDLYFGDRPNSALPFAGTLDDVQIYSRALSSSEVNASYTATSYQYYNNFTGLSNGYYSYKAYAVDAVGNKNSTEERNVTIYTYAPIISTCINLSDNSTFNGNITGDSVDSFNISGSITLCRQNYYLNGTNNIVFTINSSNAVLDCNSSSIIGNESSAWKFGDVLASNVTVKNCNIFGYIKGFKAKSDEGLIRNIIFDNNEFGRISEGLAINYVNVSGGQIINNRVSNVSNTGLSVGITGTGQPWLQNILVNNNTVINITSSGNTAVGIVMSPIDYVSTTYITGINTTNNFINMTQTGLFILSDDSNILSNNITNSSGTGITVASSAGGKASVINNSILNSGAGINFGFEAFDLGAYNITSYRNNASGMNNYGWYVYKVHNSNFSNNMLSNMNINNGALAVQIVLADGNTFSNNVMDSGLAGFYMAYSGNNSLLLCRLLL